jgi:hypothetical protein
MDDCTRRAKIGKEKNIKEEKLALEKEKMVMAPNYVDTTSLGLQAHSDVERVTRGFISQKERKH